MRKWAFALFVFLWLTGGYTAKGNLLGRDVSYALSLGESAGESQREVHDEVGRMLQPLVEVMLQSEAWQRKVMIGLMTGRIKISEIPEKALHLSEQHRKMFLFCAELFAIMSEDFGGKPSYERGYIMGRGLFEVAALFLAPETVGAKFTKLKYLEANKLKAGSGCKWLSAGGVAKLELLLAKMRTARMCFVAGTPVWTVEGLRAIEQLSAGDQVLSRDEPTGRQEYRPVVNAIVTHPAGLVHVRHAGHSRHGGGDADGDADAEEEIVCTPEHPFYVGNRAVPGFVEAGELMVGDEFQLAGGGVAEVRGLRTEVAAEGQRFTTYNFEVADFHTYFVGEAGVWVHNFSSKFCEDFFNLAKQIQKELSIADSALFGNRFKITHEAWSREKKANKIIDAVDGNQVMHVNGREDLLDYPATGGDLTKLKTQRELEDLRTEFNFLSGPYNNHHISPKWMSKRLGIPEAEWDNCPGLIMPKNPREAYFNPTEYQEKWQEAPICHAGTFAEGSLEERLKLLRNQFPGPALSVAQRQQMLIQVKQFYSSPPYDRLKLWPPTRDWLQIHIDPTLLPIE